MGGTASTHNSKALIQREVIQKPSKAFRQSEVVQKQSKSLSGDDDNHIALAFVPSTLHSFVTRNFHNLTKCSTVLEEVSSLCPPTTTFTGACVLVDISGLSGISEKFCEQGQSGLDDWLTKTNSFLEQYVHIVYAHGGDGKQS